MTTENEPFELSQLSLVRIRQWAGPTIAGRGQEYQARGKVQNLARTNDGALVAWVQGTRRYATLVDADDNGLTAVCTCPYGGVCKHAAAVAYAYLARLTGNSQPLPLAPDDDPRLAAIAQSLHMEEQDWGEEAEDEDNDELPATTPRQDLRSFLAEQTKEQLVRLLDELAGKFPEVQRALESRRSLQTGSPTQLMRELHGLIASVRAVGGWYSDDDEDDPTTDYDEIQDRLQLLLHQGHADAVLELAEDLLEAGLRRIEQSHDGDSGAYEISLCMALVFEALGQSSLPAAERMLRAVDLQLRDTYDLCAGADVFWAQPFTAADWSALVDVLLERLVALPSPQGDYMAVFQRDQLSDWIIEALQAAGREDEIIPLCEREATQTNSYVRLVKLLLSTGHQAEAEAWIVKGIAAIEATKAGQAVQLRTIQRELWEQAGDWASVAALRADEFFHQPSLSTLQSLRKAAERAGCWPAVRAAAVQYLETGKRPQVAKDKHKEQNFSSWPLPVTSIPQPLQRYPLTFPQVGVLIELAIDERRPDEVLRWYDQRLQDSGFRSSVSDNLVADAVADTHPERAIRIWKQLAESQIAVTSPQAYELAAGFLRKLGRLLERQGRAEEWRVYLARLRADNKRKRRLVETLDQLLASGAR